MWWALKLVGFGVVGRWNGAHVGFGVHWCGEKVRMRMKEMEIDGEMVYFELRVFSSKIGTKVQFWIFFN